MAERTPRRPACSSATGETKLPAARRPQRLGAQAVAAVRALVCAVLLGSLAAGLSACGGGEEGAEEGETSPQTGSFEAQVRGALRDTLRGAATARLDSAGRLAGLEFDGDVDTTEAGFSFELAARPSSRGRTFVVSQQEGGREDTSFTLMNAYLRLRGHAFAARAGSLRVRRDSTGLHGTFGLRLRGSVQPASDEASTVTARGRFEGVSSGPPGRR